MTLMTLMTLAKGDSDFEEQGKSTPIFQGFCGVDCSTAQPSHIEDANTKSILLVMNSRVSNEFYLEFL